MKKNILLIVSIMMLCLSSCKNEAVEYAEELSAELMSCTTMKEYDAVYDKITALKGDSRFMAQSGQTNEEKMEIVQATAKLIQEALAVKAILFVVPKDVNLTAEDMQQLAEQCISKKLDTMIPPYAEVDKLVKEHFSIAP